MGFDSPRWFHDQTSRCIRLSGSDLRKYLQTKLTRNVKLWLTRQAEYALAVNIKGQVLFDGEFIFLDEQSVALWVDGDVAEAAFSHLERYVITEDVSVTLTDARSWLVMCGDSAALSQELEALSLDTDLAVSADASGYIYLRPRSVVPSYRVVNPETISSTLPQELSEREQVSEAEILTEEVRRGFPRFQQDFFREKTIPLEAGLGEGIDFNKGCYLGQEIIERLHSRGTPARRLTHVSWEGPSVPAQTELLANGKNAGFVTRCVSSGERAVALAYIRRKNLESPGNICVSGFEAPLRVERIIGEE